jgi:hypothetical protein
VIGLPAGVLLLAGVVTAPHGAAGQSSVAGLAIASGGVEGAERGPRLIAARQATLESNRELRALVEAVHRDADAIVVLVGGSAPAKASAPRALRALLDGVGLLAKERRIVVGDAGVARGLSEAAGQVRQASGGAFLLVGVAPAPAIAPAGSTPIERHHSHVLVVEDPSLPHGAAGWGSETATMYWLFNRFAEGRNSAAVVAGGGEEALDESAHNVEFGRPMILVQGSGGAADAMVTLVRSTITTDPAIYRLQSRARGARLHRRPDLFRIVSIDAGASGLLAALRADLGPVVPRTP